MQFRETTKWVARFRSWELSDSDQDPFYGADCIVPIYSAVIVQIDHVGKLVAGCSVLPDPINVGRRGQRVLA